MRIKECVKKTSPNREFCKIYLNYFTKKKTIAIYENGFLKKPSVNYLFFADWVLLLLYIPFVISYIYIHIF